MNKLILNEPPLMILPSLACEVGLNEAIFAQQLHYWLDKSTTNIDNKKWVYKSMNEWEEEFPFWSNSTIKRAIKSLKKSDILLVKKLSSRVFYSINQSKIDQIKPKFVGQDDPKEGKNRGHNEPTMGQDKLKKVQIDPRKGHDELSKGQSDPSPIYNENQRDYTEITKRLPVDYTLIVREWNQFATKNSLNQISSLSSSRKKQIESQLKNSDFKKQFNNALIEIEKSKYLLGEKGVQPKIQ